MRIIFVYTCDDLSGKCTGTIRVQYDGDKEKTDPLIKAALDKVIAEMVQFLDVSPATSKVGCSPKMGPAPTEVEFAPKEKNKKLGEIMSATYVEATFSNVPTAKLSYLGGVSQTQHDCSKVEKCKADLGATEREIRTERIAQESPPKFTL